MQTVVFPTLAVSNCIIKLMRTGILAFVFLLLCVYGNAQTLSGKVTDRNTGEALIGVNIFNQDKVGATSDIDGNYALNLPVGEHTVTFKFIGYESVTQEFTLEEGDRVEFNAQMGIESTTLDLVVVTGSQFEKKLSEEMVSVDVIQSYLVENTASPDLKAALGKVPGITILDGQASIRGGGGYSYGVGSRVQLVIDDLPMLTGDLKDIQWSVIPMETVDQIEVVKGSSSVLYGSGAMNGVIHVRTGWAKEKPETKFRIYQGLYSAPGNKDARWWDGSKNPLLTGVFFSHRQRFKGLDLIVGGHGSSENSYRKGGQQQAFRVNLKTRYRDPKVKGLTYGLNANVQFQQHGRFIVWANNTDSAFIALPGTLTQDKYLFSNIDPWIQYSGDRVGLHFLKGRYYRVERRDENWNDPSVSNVMYFDYRFQNEFKHHFNLTAGLQYQYIWSFSVLYSDEGQLITHVPSAYVQLEKKFIDRISILVGLRNETNVVLGLGPETTTTEINIGNVTIRLPVIFRAGANFKVAKKTNIRTSFGQSFRFASIGEKYIRTSLGEIDIVPNNELKSERGWSAELGIKQGFRLLGWYANLDLAMFWQEFSDMIEYALVLNLEPGPDESVFFFQPDNVTRARVAGFELGLQGDGRLGPIPMRIYTGYTFNYPGDLQSDTTQTNFGIYMQNLFTSFSRPDSVSELSILKYRSVNVFKADIEVDHRKFTLGFTAEYTSYIDRIDAAFVLLPGFSEYRKLHNQGVWRLDARLAFRVSKSSSVSFVAKNFLNEFYAVRPGIMEAPRSFTLQYRLRI